MRTNVLQLLAYASVSASAMALPLYALDLGASLGFLGVILAATGFAGVVGSIAFGRLGDRMDRRLLLVVGFASSGVAHALQYWATDPWGLLWARFLVGLTTAIIPSTLTAYVYDVKRPLGKFTSYNALGWLVGSLLVVAAGWLSTRPLALGPAESVRASLGAIGPFRLLFLASALFSFLALFFALRLPSMRVRLEVPLLPWRVVGDNAHVYGGFLLRHLGATAIWTVYPLYIVALGGDLALVGWIHVVNMLAQILFLRNADRFGRWWGHARVLIVTGLALSALVFLLMALVTRATSFLPMQIIVGLSFAALWLGSLKEVLERSVERATATGLLNASMSLSNVLGPLLGGWVAALWAARDVVDGYRAVAVLGAALTLAGLAHFLVVSRARPVRRIRGPSPGPRPAGDVGP